MWKFVKTGFEGNCELFGVNIFEYKWNDTGEEAEIEDPSYNEKHVFAVYYVEIGDSTVSFAAGEFSSNVYGFYTKL